MIDLRRVWLWGKRFTPTHEHHRGEWLGWSLEFSTENESSARTIHRWRCGCGDGWADVSAWNPPLEVMRSQAVYSINEDTPV